MRENGLALYLHQALLIFPAILRRPNFARTIAGSLPVLKPGKTAYTVVSALKNATAGIGIWGMVAFHIYTIVVAYRLSGLVASILTAIWPPFTEVYWLIRYRFVSGSTVNSYSVWFLVLLLVGLLHVVCRYAERQPGSTRE
jgi:hypothetical protein